MLQIGMIQRFRMVSTTVFIAVLAGYVLTAPARAAAHEVSARHAIFAGETASEAATLVADWVITSRDAQDLPFIIVDKV